MNELQTRTAMLIGDEAAKKLREKTVCIFGIGGVGGFAAEAVARAGVGNIHLVDRDVVSDSNRNRQLIALCSTIGKPKAEVMKSRILDINPAANVIAHNCFFLPETADGFDFERYDYVIDAVDTVTAKIQLVLSCKQAGTPIISSMGTGNKLDPTRFKIADIYKTSVCPLARVMRQELKKRGVDSLKVLYSDEPPIINSRVFENGKAVPGSISFVPSVAGLIIAGEVIKDFISVI